jgi:tetratricopeptide (TPR) repeat protein
MKTHRHRLRLAIGLLAYLVIGFTVIVSTLHRDPTNSLESQASMALYEGDAAMGGLEFAEAEKKYQSAVDLVRASVGTRNAGGRASYAEGFEGWGDALKAQGRYPEAVKRYARAIEIYEKAYGAQSTVLIDPLYSLGSIHREMGRDSLANLCSVRVDSIAAHHVRIAETEVARLREVQDGDGRVLAERLMALGDLYAVQGALDRAEVAYLEAYELRTRAFGPKYYETVSAQYNRGMAAAFMGKNAVATRTLESALTLREGSFGKGHYYLVEQMSLLGELALEQGKYATADSLYSRALASLEERIGPDHNYSLKTMANVAECKAALGRFAEAKAMRERVRDVHRRLHDYISYPVGIDLLEIAEIEERAGSPSVARATCREALRVLEQAVGPRHPAALEARYYLSELDRSVEEALDPEAPAAMKDVPRKNRDERSIG